jgi:hypothetical protein
MLNLDFEAGKAAPELLKIKDEKKEIPINQALGILAEQGPFAMMLWAKTKYSNKPLEPQIGNALFNTFRPLLEVMGLKASVSNGEKPSAWLERFNQNICRDFKNLIMARQIMERVLIYARHYAKAEGKE